MKKFKSLAIATVLCGSVLFSSCMGSFNLTKSVYQFNESISSNKFVNNVIFWLCGHVVYGLTMSLDVVVFNTIEFWTGSNPVAAGETKTIKGENGEYLVKTNENGYQIIQGEESMDLVYNQENNSWNAVVNGQSTELLRFNENGTVTLSNGKTVTMDAIGMMTARQSMNSSSLASR